MATLTQTREYYQTPQSYGKMISSIRSIVAKATSMSLEPYLNHYQPQLIESASDTRCS